MNRAHVSYRIPVPSWKDDDAFAELLQVLDANRAGFDDVALFSSPVHTPRRLEEMAGLNEVMARRYKTLREHGYGAGVNLLCTVGHHDEDLEWTPAGFTSFTGADGVAAPGTYCPNDPEFRSEYLAPLFTMLAQADPDFIWLDDDIRYYGHGKVAQVCFCDHCMTLFNRDGQSDFTRPQLYEALNSGPLPERLALRARFLEFSGKSLESLFRFAARTVHAVSPAIEVGAMDAGLRSGDSADMEVLAAALEDGTGRPVRWRPGGGAYTDRAPDDFIVKAMMIGPEAAWLPDRVVNIQSEVECFNYQRLRKARHSVALEACIYNAAGMTGAAWNIFDTYPDRLEEFKPLFSALTAVRPFMDRQVAANGRVRPVGIYNGWTPRWAVVRSPEGEDWTRCGWFEGNPHFSELFAAGLSPAYRPEDAEMTILTGETARSLDGPALKAILSSGLYCDAATLDILHERGYGRLAGFRTGKKVQYNGRERFLDHAFNAGFAGLIRDCRQSFPWGHEYGHDLESPDGRGETVADLIDYHDRQVAKCVLGVYENELGGRVAVSGYYPLRDLLFHSKSTQLKRLFRWLTRDRLSAWVESYHRIVLWARPQALSLVNASFDPAEEVVLMVRTAAESLRLTDMACRESIVPGQAAGDGYRKFTLPRLEPWQIYLGELS